MLVFTISRLRFITQLRGCHWRQFHHRKQSHPKAGSFDLGSFRHCSRLFSQIGEVCGHWETKKLPQWHNAALHICRAWWERVWRCHLIVTWFTSAFRGGIKPGGVILVLTARLCCRVRACRLSRDCETLPEKFQNKWLSGFSYATRGASFFFFFADFCEQNGEKRKEKDRKKIANSQLLYPFSGQTAP